MTRDAASRPPETPSRSAIRVGEELRPREITVTANVIVAGAIAARDFEPVHHHRDDANALSLPLPGGEP